MIPSTTTSEITIDVAVTVAVATTETKQPIFFNQVSILLEGAAATLGDIVMPPALTVAGFFKDGFVLVLGAASSLGDIVMPPALTVAGLFKDGFVLLLEAAEQLDDDVNHAIHHSPVVFILGSLIGFAGVKSQGDPDFPFKTHKTLMKCSITSLLFFGIASTTQVFASAAYKGIVRLAKIACLISSIVSLASPFYL